METWVEKRDRLQAGDRLRALEERLARTDGENDPALLRRILRSIHLLIIDATLDGDSFLLDAAVDGLRRLGGKMMGVVVDGEDGWRLLGRLDTLAEEALLALERLPSLSHLADYEPESQGARFLQAIADNPGASNEVIRERIDEASTERISILGRELVERGLARKRKIGRRNSWSLTPRGTQVLGLIEAQGTRRPQREHRLPALG